MSMTTASFFSRRTALRGAWFRVIALVLASLPQVAVGSESPAPESALFPFRFDGQWGYVTPHGEIAIPFRFEKAGEFVFGLAPAKQDGKWGFIDSTGEFAIAREFDEVGNFAANGVAPAKRGDKWGYIDKSGNVVLPFDYLSAREFDARGLAGVSFTEDDGQHASASINIRGERFHYFPIHIGPNNFICVSYREKYGFINDKAEIVVPLQYDGAEAFTSAGVAKVNLGATFPREGGKWGLVNESGEVIVEVKYDKMGYKPFEKDRSKLLLVAIDGKYGFIDINGVEVIPLAYDETRLSRTEELIFAKRDGKWGILDFSGDTVLPFQYDALADFTEKGYLNFRVGELNGCMNRAFETLIEPQYAQLGVFAQNDLAFARKDGKFGFIDITGETRIPFEYDSAMSFNPRGLAQVSRNGRSGLINENGEVAVPLKYERLANPTKPSPNGLIPAMRNGKWGYVDEQGEEVIPFKYANAYAFGRGDLIYSVGASIDRPSQTDEDPSFVPYDPSNLARVELDRTRKGMIDNTGKIVMPLRFNNVSLIDDYGWTSATFEHEGKMYSCHFNLDHGWIIAATPPTFMGSMRDISAHSLIRVKRDNLYGYVDLRGNIVIPLQYDAATKFSPSGLAMVGKDGLTGCIGAKGATVLSEERLDAGTSLKNAKGEVVWPVEDR